MTLFWHNHFATSNRKVLNPFLMYQQNQVFRSLGMEQFGDLLLAVSQDPAMLVWLDGATNSKDAPNENFAREVMELFTMGHGHYTQTDVTEAARALTGWTIDSVENSNRFYFDPHSTTTASRNFSGTEGTSKAKTSSPSSPPVRKQRSSSRPNSHSSFSATTRAPRLARRLQDVYVATGGDIREIVREVLLSDDFDETADRADMIKSPAEFVVGAYRGLGLYVNENDYLDWARAMGQTLFEPPSVGGWKAGRAWINTAAYLVRVNFAFDLMSKPSPWADTFRWDSSRFFDSTNFSNADEMIDFVVDRLNAIEPSEPLRKALRAAAGEFISRLRRRTRRDLCPDVEPGVSAPVGGAMSIDRRTLLKRSCLTAAGAALPAWKAAGIFRNGAQARATADTVLVVVRLDGGNDGLNTVVPFADPAYLAARTRIGLTGSQLLPIDARTGLHPSLSSLHGYLESGKLAIVQGVGYPVQDMSHFRSNDIWESAVPERVEPSGWLGRALDRLYPMDGDGLHSALVGGGELAFLGDYNYVTTPDIAGLAVPRGPVDQIKASLAPIGAPTHDYVGHIGSIAIADATAVDAAVAAYSSTIIYPDSGLGGSLKLDGVRALRRPRPASLLGHSIRLRHAQQPARRP